MEIEVLGAHFGVLRQAERTPTIVARLIHDLAADGFPVAVVCRVLQVPRSSYYDAIAVRPATGREIEDAYLMHEIRAVHAMSRGTYGV